MVFVMDQTSHECPICGRELLDPRFLVGPAEPLGDGQVITRGTYVCRRHLLSPRVVGPVAARLASARAWRQATGADRRTTDHEPRTRDNES